MLRPKTGDASPYFFNYIYLVRTNNIVDYLEEKGADFLSFMQSIEDSKWDYSYAPGKWTLKESIIHLMDTERIMAYRALRIAHNDKTPLPGFEQDDYVAYYHAERRSKADVLDEYETNRKATVAMLKRFDDKAFDRQGTASGHAVTVLALAFIIAGHEQHHLNIIQKKYLQTV